MTKEVLLTHLAPRTDKIWFAVSSEKEPDAFSKAIQKFQGTSYSHALVIYYSQDFGRYVIANAHGKAAQLDSLEQFDSIDEVEYLFQKSVNPTERLKVMTAILELDGIDYSEGQILDIGLEAIFGMHRDSNGIDGIICSEYADRVAQASGIPSASTVVKKDIELITPKDNVLAWRHFATQIKGFKEIV